MLNQLELQSAAEGVMESLKVAGAVKVHVTISAVIDGATGEMAMAQVWNGFSSLDAIALNTLHCDAVKANTRQVPLLEELETPRSENQSLNG